MKKDGNKLQIYKFGLYGLLKNLRFFEPFLWFYFIINGLNLAEIGLLYAVREAIVYVFEIPSGVFADRFGKKNELILCFLFYIVSFVVFAFSNQFYLFVIAMTFFGLGEAFRSGTHKAMIMQFLDVNEMKESKTQVYGLTRSYSNIGSAISSVIGVVLILFTPDLSYLFFFAIIPYGLDMILILSYPSYLNTKEETSFSIKAFLKENIESVKYTIRTKGLNLTILESASFNAVFKTIKDYIQPIVLGLGISMILFTELTEDENTKIYMAIIYFVAQFVSIFVTRNAYKLEKIFKGNTIITVMWFATALTAICLGLFIHNFYMVMISFVLFYVYLNTRKPYMVERIGNLTAPNKRASVLSIDSQATSLIIIVIAPLLGFISDTFSIGVMMISLGIVMILLELVYRFQKKDR